MIRRQLRSTRTDTLSPNTTLFRSYFAANRRADWESDPVESEVYALDVAGGGVTALTDRNGPDANPLVSPDGGKIAYLGFDDKLRSEEQTYELQSLIRISYAVFCLSTTSNSTTLHYSKKHNND